MNGIFRQQLLNIATSLMAVVFKNVDNLYTSTYFLHYKFRADLVWKRQTIGKSLQFSI